MRGRALGAPALRRRRAARRSVSASIRAKQGLEPPASVAYLVKPASTRGDRRRAPQCLRRLVAVYTARRRVVCPPPLLRHVRRRRRARRRRGALMMAFSWSAKLGIVTFAPWVALIGFDVGVIGGHRRRRARDGALARREPRGRRDARQRADRAFAPARCSRSRSARRSPGGGCGRASRRTAASRSLQSALIDSTLDGICLTDADGQHPHLEPAAAAARHRARACPRTARCRSGCSRSPIRSPSRSATAHADARARARARARRRPTSSRSQAPAASSAGTRHPCPRSPAACAAASGRCAR